MPPDQATFHDPIAAALHEDIGSGDVTCRYFVDAHRNGQGRVIAKAAATVAGIDAAAEVFHRVDGDLEVLKILADGAQVRPGAEVLRVKGRVRSILTAERVALNFLQRLSGVATLTRRYVEAVAGTGATILDTRKTTPGLRLLEKAAVRAGGGTNHRIGLYDMVMVKDNHLAAESSPDHLREAIRVIRENQPDLRIELEADTLDQVRTYLGLEGVSVILLDNMSLDDLREAVRLTAGRVPLEASGGVSLETVRAIAETGVQFISVGALTHSAPAVDLSLDLLE
jgi:nicotinate-nucleotide pyrophosphorylase (carboxylating)